MKYTQEQKDEALSYFFEGFSAREIFEVTGIPEGTLYRWKSEKSSKKYLEPSKVTHDNSEDLRRRIDELEKKLDECYRYISMLKRADEKKKQYDEGPTTGWKPPQR